MNLKALELKKYILASLGERVVCEVVISDEALIGFGLQTRKNRTRDSSSDIPPDDSLAFTLITKDRVLPKELTEIVCSFVRENKGSSGLRTPSSASMIIGVSYIEHIRHVMIRRIDRRINIAIINT